MWNAFLCIKKRYSRKASKFSAKFKNSLKEITFFLFKNRFPIWIVTKNQEEFSKGSNYTEDKIHETRHIIQSHKKKMQKTTNTRTFKDNLMNSDDHYINKIIAIVMDNHLVYLGINLAHHWNEQQKMKKI